MTLEDRFIRYTSFDTQSDDHSGTTPSTARQLDFARFLKAECEAEGLVDVVLDDHGYLYATLPATDATRPTIGFISHLDTSPDCSGRDVKATVIRHYAGGDIQLASGLVTRVADYPELLRHVGHDIVVSDGTTLLGADDKAGIAAIMHAVAHLRRHPELPHGTVRLAFTPDEETGRGAEHFDLRRFAADWAYTVDGGDSGELEYENFNAAVATVDFFGISVHPGYAKGRMVNAARLAALFASELCRDDTPERTSGRQGFFHLTDITGNVERATLTLIIRDHDATLFAQRKAAVQQLADDFCHRHGSGTCHATVADQYRNMLERIQPVMHIVDRARAAMLAAGVTPVEQPIRGGTDGAQLSFRGLPCPNLFCGAVAMHGPHEFVALQTIEQAAQVIIGIVTQ